MVISDDVGNDEESTPECTTGASGGRTSTGKEREKEGDRRKRQIKREGKEK